MRMYPSAVTTYRRLIEPMKLDKYVIPKNTIIVLPIRGMQMNERYWPEPNKFIPERFLVKHITRNIYNLLLLSL